MSSFAGLLSNFLTTLTFKGVWGFVTGLSDLALIYLSARENRDGFYSKVIVPFVSFTVDITSRCKHCLDE